MSTPEGQAPPAVPPAYAAPPPTHRRSGPVDRADFERWFRSAAFVVLLLVGAIATMRLYFALENAMTTWLRYQWQPIAEAAFSLIMLAVVVWLIRAWIIGKK